MPVLAPSIPEDHPTSSFPSSDGQAHPRPPKAPPLTSMPSTPGPVVPGGYPRNSGVFAGNQWDHSQNGSSGTGTGAGLFAAARTYLPPGMASYFPDVPASSTSASTSPPASSSSPPTTTTPPLLNTDGSTASDFSTRAAYAGSASDAWSRGARAGAGTPTPVPSEYTYTAAQQQRTQPQQAEGEQWDEEDESRARPRATSGLMPSHPGVGAPSTAPSTLPASPVSPVSPTTTSTSPSSNPTSAITTPSTTPFSPSSPAPASSTRIDASFWAPGLSAASPASPVSSVSPTTPPSPPTSSAVTTPSTAPSSPASPTTIDASFWASPKTKRPASHSSNSPKAKGGSGFLRFGHSARAASAVSDAPSSAPSTAVDSSAPSPGSAADSANSPAPNSELTGANGATDSELAGVGVNGTPHTKHTPTHTHKPSLLRTLRGEATVLAGRVRRDPGRVERGRRMIDG